MVTLSKTLNASTLKLDVFVTGKQEVRDSEILNAVTGYTPAYGDVLVYDKSDSSKHSRYDFDFVSTTVISTALTTAAVAFANTSKIDPDSIKIFADTAIGADSAALSLGTDFSFDNAIPGTATVDTAVSGVAADATISYTYVEENKDQEIIGIIDEIDDTDTANITLSFKKECVCMIDNVGTDGTSTTAKKKILKDKLRDINIDTMEG